MKYVIITPARNEEKSIRATIESVISQYILPEKWVIVSDASTDNTDAIIKQYLKTCKFIHFIRKDVRKESGFASKVSAFNIGYKAMSGVEYSFIGNLDADISFGPAYFERVLKEFKYNPKLGISGGRVYENINSRFHKRKSSSSSVAGAVQMFRKQCYDQIGGYIPLANGGIDAAAEIIARSKGWQVKTIMDLPVLHAGRVLTGSGNLLRRKFNQGATHYQLGYSWSFEVIRQFYRITDSPFLLSTLARLSGFFWAYFKKKEIVLPTEAARYFRREQALRLKKLNPIALLYRKQSGLAKI